MADDETIWRCDLVPQYQQYAAEIMAAVARVLGSGRYTLAEEVKAFETEFARYLGAGHCVGVADGTEGLILSMKALGIGPGDEVITTPFTAIPTVSAIIAAGARPVFVDIDPATYLIDLDAAARAVGERTRAVIPVHIFGNALDVPRLRGLLPGHVAIIEDAAQAHGSTINGRHCGALGTMGVFSFYPTKNLGGYGDGGAIVTGDAELDRKLRLLRMYGMTDKDHIEISGVNSRLDELQAAILRVKLSHLDAMNQRRREIAGRYQREVGGGLLDYQRVAPGVIPNYHVLAARVRGERQKLIEHLEARKIQTNIYYLLPLHLQKANRFLGYRPGDFPVCEDLCDQVIALPMYPELPEKLLDRIIQALNDFELDKVDG